MTEQNESQQNESHEGSNPSTFAGDVGAADSNVLEEDLFATSG